MPSEARISSTCLLRRTLLLIALWAMCSGEAVSAKMPAFSLEGRPLKESAKVVEKKAGDLLQSVPFERHADRDILIAYGNWRGIDGTIAVERATKTDRADWPRRAAAADVRPLFDGWFQSLPIYLATRVERRNFPWGEAVTALTQGTQLRSYSPNNDGLQYELRGITKDGKYLITAVFEVNHRRLPANWEKARQWSDDASEAASEAATDPDVRMLNKAAAGDFSPSLKAIDDLLATLREPGH